jgi:general secretion pathway protein G
MNIPPQTYRSTVRGFTLIELLVVLLILGMLAGLAGPSVMKHIGGSKVKTAKAQVELFGTALDTYKMDNGKYPTTQEGLQVLIQKPASGGADWQPYLKKNVIPKDPWNNEYQYSSPGKDNRPYDIVSFGADGKEGGEGDDQDISSWN